MKTLILIAIFWALSPAAGALEDLKYKEPDKKASRYGFIGLAENLYEDGRFYSKTEWRGILDRLKEISDSLSKTYSGLGSATNKLDFYIDDRIKRIAKKDELRLLKTKGYHFLFVQRLCQVIIDPAIFFRNYSKEALIPFAIEAMSAQYKFYHVRGKYFDAPETVKTNAVAKKLTDDYRCDFNGLVSIYYVGENEARLEELMNDANLFLINNLFLHGRKANKYFPIVISTREELKIVSKDFRYWMGGLFDGHKAVAHYKGRNIEKTKGSVLHELTHYAQARRLRIGRPSVFVLEAEAQFMENSGASFDTSGLLHYYNLDLAPSLKSLWNAVPVEMTSRSGVEMFYDLSEVFGHWIIKVKGKGKYVKFWKKLRKSTSGKGAVAFEKTYKMTLEEAEVEFNEYVVSVLKKKYGETSRRVAIAEHLMD